MADNSRRGKKQNHDKNFGANKAWQERKRAGRPKQIFVDNPTMASVLGGFKGGHWEKTDVIQQS